MSDDEGEAIYYLSREEFKKRIAEMNTGYVEVAKRYTDRMLRVKDEKTQDWFKKQIDDLTSDIIFNNGLMTRADIEKGYQLFWVDGEGNLKCRRCTQREHNEIYKPRKNPNYVV